MIDKTLSKINFAVFCQQQRYIVAISYLFYISQGLTLSDFLLFQSIFYFTGLLAEIPAGYIGDIFSRKSVLIFSYLLFMVRILLWIFIPNYYTILIGEILYGLSKAFYRGVSDGYIYDYLKVNNAKNLMLNKYGNFNFYMSIASGISCLIGAWLYKFLGFSVLLCFELFFNSVAIFALIFLPEIPSNKPKIRFYEHITRIFSIIKSTAKEPQLNLYMLYGGILFGTTSVFVWNFQPFMKHFAIPVYIFGLIYFINHILRALGSKYSEKILQKISLIKIGRYVWILYVLGFLIMAGAMNMKGSYICIATLIFICFAIGIQMVFNIGNLVRIHNLIESNKRATISSINSMLASLFSGGFLALFRFISNNSSIKASLVFFLIIFSFSIIILNRIKLNKIY